jgi:hypothetical protein
MRIDYKTTQQYAIAHLLSSSVNSTPGPGRVKSKIIEIQGLTAGNTEVNLEKLSLPASQFLRHPLWISR